MNVETKLASAIEPQALGNIVSRIRNAAEVTMQKMAAESNLQNSQVETLFSSAVGEAIKNVSSNAVASQVAAGLANANADKIANVSAEKIANQTLAMGKRGPVCMSTVKLSAAANVMSAFNSVMVSNSAALKSQNASAALCSQIGDVISQTAMGNRPTLGVRAPIY